MKQTYGYSLVKKYVISHDCTCETDKKENLFSRVGENMCFTVRLDGNKFILNSTAFAIDLFQNLLHVYML